MATSRRPTDKDEGRGYGASIPEEKDDPWRYRALLTKTRSLVGDS